MLGVAENGSIDQNDMSMQRNIATNSLMNCPIYLGRHGEKKMSRDAVFCSCAQNGIVNFIDTGLVQRS